VKSILLTLVLIFSCTQLKANLLTNGSFETHDAAVNSGSGLTQFIDNPTTYLNNSWTFGRTAGTGGNPRFHWYSTTNQQTWQNNPQDGSYAIQLNSDNTTDFIYVEQSVNVISGTLYQLSFFYVDESAFTITNPTSVRADLTGAFVGNQTFTNTIDNTWQQGIITFTAASTGSLTIRFTDQPPAANNNQNVSMDNISLIVVPEPSTYAMGILLVLAVGGFHFWRRREA